MAKSTKKLPSNVVVGASPPKSTQTGPTPPPKGYVAPENTINTGRSGPVLDGSMQLSPQGTRSGLNPTRIVEVMPPTSKVAMKQSGAVGGGIAATVAALGEDSPASATVTWSDGYTLAGAPAWWRGRVPSALDADTEYLAILNSLLPYMSPEDQVRMATNMARINPEAFGMYTADVMNTLQDTFPTEISTELVDRFTSAERGTAILKALSKFQKAAGMKEDTEGTRFLRDVAASLRDFGGDSSNRQTRTKLSQLRGLLDPMFSSANTNSLAAYGELGKTLANPFFSAGEMSPTYTVDGKMILGAPNSKLF